MSGSDGGLTGRREAKRKIMRSSVLTVLLQFPWGTCMTRYQLVYRLVRVELCSKEMDPVLSIYSRRGLRGILFLIWVDLDDDGVWMVDWGLSQLSGTCWMFLNFLNFFFLILGSWVCT